MQSYGRYFKNLKLAYRILDLKYLFQTCINLLCFFTATLPNITSLSPDQTINEGDTLSIMCQYNALPRPKQTWMYENRPLEESSNIVIKSNGTFSELRVLKFTMAMSGRYQCLVENRVGLNTKNVNIEIEGKYIVICFSLTYPLPLQA